jgi:hypothetical protein
MNDKSDRDEAKVPGPVMQVDDHGLTSPDPTPSTTDPEPSSALGGGTATRTVVPDKGD